MKKRIGKRLSEILPQNLACVSNSFDIVGDIAIVRPTKKHMKLNSEVGRAIMTVHRNVKTVLAQTNAVNGEFRLRELKHVIGEKRVQTVHRESGCLFSVDVAKCYFSPRLSNERKRIADQATDGETVVNMFAGVGCFSILLAKHPTRKIFSIDINPVAVRYMEENVRVNGVYGRVVPILGDARQIIKERLRHVADRVLMPLPEKAFEYLPYSLLALKNVGGWIHYYDFVHAGKDEDAVEKVTGRVQDRLHSLVADFEVAFGRIVRATGPNWYQVVLDIRVGCATSKRSKA